MNMVVAVAQLIFLSKIAIGHGGVPIYLKVVILTYLGQRQKSA